MRQVLILQHDWEDHKGYIGNILEEYGISDDAVHVPEDILPDPRAYAAIFAFGGREHLYESDLYPYLAPEKALIRQAVEQDIPFLGICLGSQVLASALGAPIKKLPVSEIGFFEVPFTTEGKSDPLHKRLPGFQKVFHWHGDTFDLPSGAVLLATNEHTKNQAFRYGRCAYGVQYHIEVTPPMLDAWLGLYHEDLYGDIAATIDKDRNSHFSPYHAHTHKMIENFPSMSELI